MCAPSAGPKYPFWNWANLSLVHVFLFGADSQRSPGIAAARHLAAAGHSVTSLTWFDAKIRRRGHAAIDYLKGSLEDRAVMRRFEKADAVIDTTFPRNHAGDSMDELAPSRIRPRVLRRLLAGTGKPLVITTSFCVPGPTGRTPVAESAPARPLRNFIWMARLEREILRARDISGVVIRPAIEYGGVMVYGVDILKSLALRRRRAIYIGDGQTRWSTVHYDDLGALYAIAAAQARPGLLLHAAAESLTQLEIAEALRVGCGFQSAPAGVTADEAKRLLPIPIVHALRRNHVLSGDAARMLGWQPSQPSLLQQIYNDLTWYRERRRKILHPPDKIN